jgi:uncharacterized protein YgiM (DUF1202 family)
MNKTIAVSVLLLLIGMLAFAAPTGPNEAYVILNNLALYSESGGTLKWAESLAIGDKVVLLNRTSKFKVEGKEREYTKVRSPSAKEGWVLGPYIAAKSALGVVKADSAVVYSEPRDVKITAKHISNLTIVAVMQEGGAAGFVKVVCHDIAQNAYFTDPVFVSSDDLTVAANKYGSSLFIGRIQEAMGTGGAPRATTATSGRYSVNSDKVNVRGAPDEKASQVVAQLNNGDEVSVIEMTSQSYTVDGQTARWFRVEDPSGWIFGSFLAPLQ